MAIKIKNNEKNGIAMCGRLNVSDDPFVIQLVEQLGIENPIEKMRFGRFIRATDVISIIREGAGKRQLEDATWWLLLEKSNQGFKPSKYTSFNTRYDKLNLPRSAGYSAFRQSRCIIPVKGFGETEFVNKKPKHYFDMIAKDGEAIALGGLYRQWLDQETGEFCFSCSVITLPPHPKLKAIHSKAMPLILPKDHELLDNWLSSDVTNPEIFEFLLQAHLPQDLVAQQIDKPSLYHKIAEPFLISKD